ncbi:MAG: chemotaxis protein CheX [Desulfobacterales bacterium]|nr:chemotaxis protein CheX [Desulfobacterales bacterium]
MSDRIKAIVIKETVQTLEKLAFIFAMPEEEDIEPEEGQTVDVAIRFNGPFSGSMLILYPQGDLDELAANMLGLDDEDEISGDQKLDALKETINIVCGNILPEIGGKEAIFDIAPPAIINEPGARPDVTDAVKVQLDLDEGPCFIYFNFEGSIPEI